jgi:hypothetical protein
MSPLSSRNDACSIGRSSKLKSAEFMILVFCLELSITKANLFHHARQEHNNLRERHYHGYIDIDKVNNKEWNYAPEYGVHGYVLGYTMHDKNAHSHRRRD